jgi:hypothetical protein
MKRLAILAAGSLALLGTTAAQAAAAQEHAPAHQAATTCGFDFTSLRTLTGRGGAHGPFGAREARLRHGGDAQALAKAKRKAERGFRRTIRVYVHVLVNPTPNPALPFDDVGRISAEKLEEQVNVLNLAYGGFGGGADSGFRFRLHKVDYTENAAWYGADFGSPEELALKRALRAGKPDDLNLYVKGGIGSPNSVAGWAYMPDILEEPAEVAFLDGVVVDHRTLPGGPIPGFDLGHTATHEVGHWLGLYHTFEGGCSPWSDRVADTPAERSPAYECIPRDSCGGWPGLDPIHNFMDYTEDACMFGFTPGQAERSDVLSRFFRFP